VSAAPSLGLRANAAQFALLVALNGLVGAMVGLERSVLPLVGEREFKLTSTAAILAFVVAFGLAKAFTNLAAGALADRVGRKRLLVLGWLVALPVPLLIGLAPSWSFIVAANVLLGINQGLAWSMTVVMKIDLAGPARRGLALGLNEAAGYLGVAAAALASGALAAHYAPRTVIWIGAALIAGVGLVASVVCVRDTAGHVAVEQRAHARDDVAESPPGFMAAFRRATLEHPVLRACNQAGLVNNLNDALAWGLTPLYLAAHGATVREIAIVAAAYPLVWGVGQLATGWISDHIGRKPLITAGMLVQAAALTLLVAGGGSFTSALPAALLLGVGTAMVYPTLIAAVSDATQPRDRARIVGVYRFWRDIGFAVGALAAGVVTDLISADAAIGAVAALTAASGLVVAATRWGDIGGAREPAGTTRRTIEGLLEEARSRLVRLGPTQALAAQAAGALLVDVRGDDQRREHGCIPGAIIIPRNVLEWRADPACAECDPRIAHLDALIVIVCQQGYQSSLAAGTLQELGFTRATDLDGGFEAWSAAGLPIEPGTRSMTA
jgi:MFS family permease